jgi:hypothetical protein
MILFEYDYDMCNLPLNESIQQLNEEDLERLFVSSSNVHSFWFKDSGNGIGTLTIEFNNGAEYEYYQVPYTLVKYFTVAPSFGRFVWKNIRGRFPYKRVDVKGYPLIKPRVKVSTSGKEKRWRKKKK